MRTRSGTAFRKDLKLREEEQGEREISSHRQLTGGDETGEIKGELEGRTHKLRRKNPERMTSRPELNLKSDHKQRMVVCRTEKRPSKGRDW